MAEYSIGDAITQLMQKSGWKPKVTEVRIKKEWEQMTSKTIAKYTRNLYYDNGILTIYTDVAALKQELNISKPILIKNINEYLGETAIKDIVVK